MERTRTEIQDISVKEFHSDIISQRSPNLASYQMKFSTLMIGQFAFKSLCIGGPLKEFTVIFI
jgi:hypothetical protein